MLVGSVDDGKFELKELVDVKAFAVFVFTWFVIDEYNVSFIPLFTILSVVIDVDVGNVDVGK